MALIPFDGPLLAATFNRRRKRFFADMTLADGQEITAHCPNTGTMRSCLEEGAPALVWDSQNPARKLRYSFKAILIGGIWIGIDTQLPNRLAAAAIAAGEIPPLRGYTHIQPEFKMGENSRVDLLLTSPRRSCYVEVKNVTLVENGVARFPDAVTERGQKHLRELMARIEEGHQAAMLYVIQREDARWFTPADEIDPVYGILLREAKAKGVKLIALLAAVSFSGVKSVRIIPVRLGA
jgi:sugar fermentation stimulation protein A